MTNVPEKNNHQDVDMCGQEKQVEQEGQFPEAERKRAEVAIFPLSALHPLPPRPLPPPTSSAPFVLVFRRTLLRFFLSFGFNEFHLGDS